MHLRDIVTLRYQTSLSVEECHKRLTTEEYYDEMLNAGTPIFTKKQSWVICIENTKKGAIKLTASQPVMSFLFRVRVESVEGKTQVICSHNPFGFLALFVPVLIALLLIFCMAVLITDNNSSGGLFCAFVAVAVVALAVKNERDAQDFIMLYIRRALKDW